MGFLSLFEVASMPMIQVLIISGLGAFMATDYCNIFNADARKSMNKVVYVVFIPALTFSSLAKSVTFEDIISWWFMPFNVGLTFLIGGALGWIAVKLLKPGLHLEGLIMACCSASNLGNLVLIVLPAICREDGSPFGGDHDACASTGLSYATFSMALGNFYIWTYTFQLVKSSSVCFKQLKAMEEEAVRDPNKDLESNEKAYLLNGEIQASPVKEALVVPAWRKIAELLSQMLKELMAPPTVAALFGLIFGAVTWLKHLIIGEGAPFRVLEDTIKLLGDGSIPCMTLILGGNLIEGTMTQFFDVGQEECSVIFLWTYVFAAFALTFWSTVFLWFLF